MRICRSCRRPQPCAMIVAMGHDRCCGRLRPSGLHLLAVAFGHGPSGGIEQSCQKAVGGSNGHGVQTGHEADSHGRERELGKGPRPAGQTAQPPVRPPGGEQCGTRSGREQDAEAAGVSVRIGIVVQEQQDEQELRVEFTGLGVACPGVALSCRKAALPAIQCRCKHKRQCGKGEVYGNPHHR